jgi:glycosyltransferase involved in cell wall biosynthesis
MLSVVIISYCRQKDVIECIESIKKIVTIDYEVIVVCNDGHVYDPMEHVWFVLPSQNLGVAGGRNFGASKAKGEWLFFIDDDAVISSFNIQLNLLPANIGIVSVISRDYYTNEIRDHENPRINGTYSSKYVGVGHLIRKEVFEICKGYSVVSNYGMEEYNLQYKAYNKGWLIGNSPIVVRHKKSNKGRLHELELKDRLAITKIKLVEGVVPIEVYWLHLFFWSLKILFFHRRSILGEVRIMPKKKIHIDRCNFYYAVLKTRANVFY